MHGSGLEGARMTQQPAKSQEPSMEGILASIGRIIADDDASKSAARPPEPLKAVAPDAGPAAIIAPRRRAPMPDTAKRSRGSTARAASRSNPLGS